MKNYFIYFYFILLIFLEGQEISFIRYYANEKDFIANVPIKASDRRGYDHLAAYFDDRNLAVKLEYYLSNGSLNKREIMEYNKEKELIRKGEVNAKGNYIKLVVYSKEEPWSQEFQKWCFSENHRIKFNDQHSIFFIPRGKQVSEIIFQTVDGLNYGKVQLDYDYLNFLTQEKWRELPSGKVIRRFNYKFDLLSNVTQIWEYGKEGELISEVALDMVPADQLYRTPPPRTGNILDEYEIIAKEIKEKRIISSNTTIIPQTEEDQLILKTGQTLLVDFVGTNQNGIQFRLKDDSGLLTIPFDNVRSLTSRFGDVIYPEAIEYRKR